MGTNNLSSMSRLLGVLGLVTVALLGLGGAHRYKGAEYKQTKGVPPNFKEPQPDWLDSHGYEECPEFLTYEDHDENYVEGDPDKEKADNGLHHLLNRHWPKPVKEICPPHGRYQCPDMTRRGSIGCGFEEVTIPGGNWWVIDVSTTVRDAYNLLKKYRYDVNKDPEKKMAFAVPLVIKQYLDENGEVEREVLAFYIAEPYQDDPPEPQSGLGKIAYWPEAKIYVRPYGGYRGDKQLAKQYDLLEKALEKAGLNWENSVHLELGYTYLRYGRQRIEAGLYALENVM